jgi:hypothetical protein
VNEKCPRLATISQLTKITHYNRLLQKILKQKLKTIIMKTLFAFLGLFMFASVTSTDFTDKNIANEEPQLMETGEYSTSPSKKADIVAKKSVADTGEYSTSPSKKADIVAKKSVAETGEYSTSPSKKADIVAKKAIS